MRCYASELPPQKHLIKSAAEPDFDGKTGNQKGLYKFHDDIKKMHSFWSADKKK
jgi:hypothetical protein